MNRAITVDRGSRGFGLSLIYRGLDKYEEKDTGIFVAKIVPDGQAERFGVREHDKVLTINGKTPSNVENAVGLIKQAGSQIKLTVLREEEGDGNMRTGGEGDRITMSSQEIKSSWMKETRGTGGQTVSQPNSKSARRFINVFGRTSPRVSDTSSPPPLREPIYANTQKTTKQHEILRQQEEYQSQQRQASAAQTPNENGQQQLQKEQDRLNREMEQRKLQTQHAAKDQQQRQKPQQFVSDKDTVRGIIESSKFGKDSGFERSKSARGRITEESQKLAKNVTTHIERGGGLRSSTRSLHLDTCPNSPMKTPTEFSKDSRLTRKEEKSALQCLNNRLAGYIDRVRTLQNKNQTLFHQVLTFEEYKQTEISNVKDLYEKQIEELKKALEDTTENYHQLQTGAEGLLHENEDLKDKAKTQDVDLINSMDKVNSLEEELRNLSNTMLKKEDEYRRTHDQFRGLLPEREHLRARLGNAKGALDKEHLKSADLENRCRKLEEDLNFKISSLEKEVVEIKYQKEGEITMIDGKLHDEYEDRLQKALQELRDMYDNKMQKNREDFEKRYEHTFRDLQSQLAREHGSTAGSAQELEEARARVDALINKISDLESANLALNQKIADMAQQMKDQRAIYRTEIPAKDNEIKRVLDELSNQMKEYISLQEIKIAMDMEISVFRGLLESEEDRFNI